MKKIKKFKINIRERQLFYLLRYKENITEDTSELKFQIKKEVLNAYQYIKPATVYNTYNINEVAHLFKGSKDLYGLVENCSVVSIFIVTIGPLIEQKIKEYVDKGELAIAAIYDAIGSEAAEQAANFVSRLLKEESSLEGFETTARFSPGYGDWDVSSNIDILKVLNSEKVELVAENSGMLTPRKSITALVGWQKSKARNKTKIKFKAKI